MDNPYLTQLLCCWDDSDDEKDYDKMLDIAYEEERRLKKEADAMREFLKRGGIE